MNKTQNIVTPKPFTAKQLQRAIDLRKKGQTYAKIATRFGLKASTVWSRLKDK